jgi:hypothetical protein
MSTPTGLGGRCLTCASPVLSPLPTSLCWLKECETQVSHCASDNSVCGLGKAWVSPPVLWNGLPCPAHPHSGPRRKSRGVSSAPTPTVSRGNAPTQKAAGTLRPLSCYQAMAGSHQIYQEMRRTHSTKKHLPKLRLHVRLVFRAQSCYKMERKSL